MPNAAIPDNEAERLAALNELGILYAPLEDRLDRITRTLCRLFDVPFAYISLIDSDTQWIKSIQGMELVDSPRSTSICSHALLVDEYIVCEDLSIDQRFSDSSLVTAGLELRFYAGFTLKSRGLNIGTVCIVDTKPRQFNQEDIATMRDMVSWAQTEVSLTQLSEVQVQLLSELDQAQHEAKIDGLTGLWNQVAIKDVLKRAYQRHLLTQQPYSIMMIDIDNFKAINDAHGHPFGDQIIQSIAETLSTSLRPSDAIGRYGGDEFLVILENCSHVRAEELSRRILTHNHSLIFASKGEDINCSMSIGFSSTEKLEVDSPESLLEHADQSLYHAKEGGRNCARG